MIFGGCSSDGGDAGSDQADQMDGTASADDSTPDTWSSDTQPDTGGAPPSIASVVAPTRTEVKVAFAGGGDAQAKGAAESYAITCQGEALAVEKVAFDAIADEATLTTERQKLGFSCDLTADLEPKERGPLTASFEAADTADFWVNDFSDPTGMTQYEIKARRVLTGRSCVIYLEEGAPNRFSQGMVDYFDEDVYPLETEVFGPPKDLDGNERVVILGLDGGNAYGGYFSPINALQDILSMSLWGLHSNEMELLHVNVTAMTGDGGIFEAVVPHELQHLLYNAYHGMNQVYWAYHDEGLAEVAVHLVNGSNEYAVGYYFGDHSGLIGDGLSLVNWTYAQYENYALAYLFWMYAASRLGGLEYITDIFELPTGSPLEVDELLRAGLGTGLSELHFESLAALWAQAPSGKWGYGQLVELGGEQPPCVSAGGSSVDLQPFAGAFYCLAQGEVDYPGTQGVNIVYAGIDGDKNVDLTPPFAISGGALLAYNTSFEFVDFRAEPSGPDFAPLPADPLPYLLADEERRVISPAWDNPPPVWPPNAELIRQWQRARALREILR